MAPSLRSSAPNTPSKSSTGSDTPTLTPRKVPHCTKCKRPRAGHPRSGCPYIDSPSKDGTEKTPPPPTNNIANALGSMHIASPVRERDEDTKAEIRNRRRSSVRPANLAPAESLMSLSSNSQEIVDRLLQPGMFDNDTDDDGTAVDKKGKTKIVKWQDTIIATSGNPKTRVKMPGALSSPSPYSSTASVKKPNNADTSKSLLSTINPNECDILTNTPRHPQPLIRSMSLEQREDFVSNLRTASDATVYIVPSADIRDIQTSAVKLGFHAKIIVSADDKDPEALLVLGGEEKSVQTLFNRVEKESKKPSAGRLRVAAGGAVVGAVGAWAGLAFS